MDLTTPAARLRYLRETKGWTARETDRRAHSPEGTCAIIEKRADADHKITSKTAERYAAAFDVPRSWLMFGEGPPPALTPETAHADTPTAPPQPAPEAA